MNSIFELSRPFEQLKKQEKFSEALELFKQNKVHFTNEQIAQNFYLVSDMLTCLRKLNLFEAGFKFLDIYNIQINDNTNDRILTSYGWFLYSNYKFENSNPDESELDNYSFDDEDESYNNVNYELGDSDLLIKIDEVLPLLLRVNNDFSKSVISNLFNIVLKSEKKKPAPNWKLINDFCNKFLPESLSNTNSTIQVERKGRLQDMELASDKENWYAYKTKALFKLGEWQECFDLSKKALEEISNPHYSNDVWFSRRIALSKKSLGNSEDAVLELKIILKKKKEWFIQKELAEIYFSKGEIYKAFKYAIEAINNFGPLEFKVDLLFLLGSILKSKDDLELAFKHFSLSKLIRQNEEWKIPQKLNDELNKFNTNDIRLNEYNTLLKELKNYWNTFKPQQTKPTTNKTNNNQQSISIRTS